MLKEANVPSLSRSLTLSHTHSLTLPLSLSLILALSHTCVELPPIDANTIVTIPAPCAS
jgi:hypothetical protein